jgi:hypothetical protein
MAKDDAREGKPANPDPEIAAADWLFQDDPTAKSARPAPQSAGLTGAAAGAGSGEIFALADGGSSVEIPVQSPVPPVFDDVPKRKARPKQDGKSARVADEPMLEPSALVEEVWSRRAEWGMTLIVVGAWLAVVLGVVYFSLEAELYGLAFVTLLMGAAAAVVLSYPIFITLERPVRITPEQAVRDYYGALSHHVPHFRRMWLLLSTAGRISTAYGSLDGFKAYWKSRLANLRAGHASSFTPLVFEVADFKADKSAGKVKIDAEYTLKVWVRGQRKSGVIHAIPMKIALVRGPDKMWYLDEGTLGRESRPRMVHED